MDEKKIHNDDDFSNEDFSEIISEEENISLQFVEENKSATK